MKYIYITTLVLVILYLLTPTNDVPPTMPVVSSQTQTEAQSSGRNLSREDEIIYRTPPEYNASIHETPRPVIPIAAKYREYDRAWTFFAKVLQLRDVSIYGRPGRIAQIEYMREGELQYAWAVLKIDDYYFSDDAEAIAEGQEIILEVSGDYVSSQGVNWDTCRHTDEYCRYASFIEGGFPVSEDYNGLTMCPSNMLIYSGYGSADWINGMLAWKIKAIPVKAAQDCIDCSSGTGLDYFP